MGYDIKKEKFYWIYLIGFLLILALPLISVYPAFHPSAWGKTILFRIIFSILIFIFAYQILFNKNDNRFRINIQNLTHKKNINFWSFCLLTALFGIFLLATIFSLEPYFSVWGSPYRAGGFINYAFYILFALFIFLILKQKDWKKIWTFVFAIGSLIALIAIFQKFGLLEEHLTSYANRPASTLGGPASLAIYLLLLIFLSFSFGIIAKGKKKFFYFLSFILILFALILTATRSAFLGIFIGFSFFIFFFPLKSKRILNLKILFGIIIILTILGVLWLNEYPQFIEILEKNKILGESFSRIWSFTSGLSIQGIFESRGDGWKVALRGIKDRPILGYGPENFSIAFDKYYDPNLTGIQSGTNSTGWWDRGHNFLIDYSINAGVPALIIYLSLFGILFWQLQKVKSAKFNSANIITSEKEYKATQITTHGIQATFIGYFIVIFFSFDAFSTYLISFLLIGYSLSIIKENNITDYYKQVKTKDKTKPWKYVFLLILFFFFILFIWNFNLRPFWVNKEINQALLWTNNGFCQKAVNKMDSLLEKHTIIDNYVRLQYIDIIGSCVNKYPDKTLELSLKAVPVLEEAVKLRTNHTRSWQFLGIYTAKIIASAEEKNEKLKSELKKELIEKSYFALNKALELSPKRQKTLATSARIELTLENFEKAKEKAQQCIDIYSGLEYCWWTKALAEINLGEIEEAEKSIEMAEKNGYPVNSESSLNQLIKIYLKIIKKTDDIKYHQHLAKLYLKLIEHDSKNFQYHASLAYIYKVLGQYDKARQEAMIVLELSPESKEKVEGFLRTLPH